LDKNPEERGELQQNISRITEILAEFPAEKLGMDEYDQAFNMESSKLRPNM